MTPYEKRIQTLIKKYGEAGFAQKRKEWGSKGGKKGHRSYAKLSVKQRQDLMSAATKQRLKLIRLGKEIANGRE